MVVEADQSPSIARTVVRVRFIVTISYSLSVELADTWLIAGAAGCFTASTAALPSLPLGCFTLLL